MSRGDSEAHFKSPHPDDTQTPASVCPKCFTAGAGLGLGNRAKIFRAAQELRYRNPSF